MNMVVHRYSNIETVTTNILSVMRGLRVLREQLFQLVYSRLRASGVYSYDEESPLYFKAKLAYTEARLDRRL